MLKSQISRTGFDGKSGFDGKHKIKDLAKVIITAIAVTAVVFLSVYSCKDKIIGPGNDPGPKPGRRDYVWEVDTLEIPFGSIYRVWGSSPTDVWAVPIGSDAEHRVWYYDGKKWETKSNSRIPSLGALWGFSENDVWVGGDEGTIWHYKGYWHESVKFTYEQEPNKRIYINDIWGLSANNIYAVGQAFESLESQNDFIAHYDGTKWTIKYFENLQEGFVRIKGDNSGKYYIKTDRLRENGKDSTSIYQYDGNNTLIRIYHGKASNEKGTWVQYVNEEIFFQIGRKICRYTDGEFVPIFTNNNFNIGFFFYGNRENNLFLGMTDGLAHYNGTDIQYLFQFDKNKNIHLLQGMIFENEIFFAVRDFTNNLNLIYHGMLK